MNNEESCLCSTAAAKKPVFAFMALIFIPVAYVICWFYVREKAAPDLLGFDMARAVRHSHWPASLAAFLISLRSLARGERFRTLGLLLVLIAGVWFAFSAFIGSR